MTAHKFRAVTRVPWRLRVRVALGLLWLRMRHGRRAKALAVAANEALTVELHRRCLYGLGLAAELGALDAAALAAGLTDEAVLELMGVDDVGPD